MKDHHKKESPILSLQSLGGGSNSQSSGAGLPPDGDPWYAQYTNSGAGYWMDFGSAIDVDASRNIFVATSGNSAVVYLVKFDNDGAHQWTKRIHNLYGEGRTSIATSGTDVYMIGTYGSGGWIGKWNESGTLQWQKRFSTGNTTHFRDVTTDPSGNVYVTGWSTADSNSTSQVVTVKYNSSGSLQWTKKTYFNTPSNGLLKGQSITYVPASGSYSAGIVVSGDASNYYEQFGSYTHQVDLMAIRFDLDGTHRWTKGIGDQYYYMAINGETYSYTSDKHCTKNLVSDSSGNVYLGGLYGSHYNDTQSLIVKLSDSGSLTWARKIGYNARTVATTGLSISNSGDLFQTYTYLHGASNSTGQGHIVQIPTSTGVGAGGTEYTRSSIFYKSTGSTWSGSQGHAYLRGVHTDSRGRIYVLGEGKNFLRSSSDVDIAIWKLDPELINGVYDSGNSNYKYSFSSGGPYYNQDPLTHNAASYPTFQSRTMSVINDPWTGYTDDTPSFTSNNHSGHITSTISWNPGNP